eukprot:3335463-Prymnesium_polylepis.1
MRQMSTPLWGYPLTVQAGGADHCRVRGDCSKSAFATGSYSVLNAAKRECSSVSSFADLERSPCIFPAAEKTRSTPADDAGAAKNCFTILARLGHFDSLAAHQLRTLTSSSGSSGSARYCSSSSNFGSAGAGDGSFLTRPPSRLPRLTLRCFFGGSIESAAGAAAGAA